VQVEVSAPISVEPQVTLPEPRITIVRPRRSTTDDAPGE
jgi:hypothetical protein